MAATAEDDHCAVCAEPMVWAAYGRCGHTDSCSQCTVRLRAVLRDTRCVICQQPSDAVVVTRALGAYSRVLPPEAFDELKVKKERERAAAGARSQPRLLSLTFRFLFIFTRPKPGPAPSTSSAAARPSTSKMRLTSQPSKT